MASTTTTGGNPISAFRMTITTSRPGKRVSATAGARRHAHESGENEGRQADDERQPHDRKQRRIAGEKQLKRRNVVRHGPLPRWRHVAFWQKVVNFRSRLI